jgi:hypothetical protein
VNQWLNPLKRGTGSNLVDAGRAAVRAVLYVRGRRLPASDAGGEAIGESLRRTRGEAAAARLDVDPVDRDMVNVGIVSGLPSPASNQLVGGQAHRRLTTSGRDGGSVVVRAQESCAHGEGTQRVRSERAGMRPKSAVRLTSATAEVSSARS